MPDYLVSISFTGREAGINLAFKKMADGADHFGDAASRNFSKASKMSSGFMNSFKGNLAAGAIQRGLGFIQQGVSEVATQFIDFDDAIYGATARFEAAEAKGTDMVMVMQNLRDAARQVGSETQFTATQAAQGLDKFALAGFTSTEAIQTLKSQIDLATVTGEDFMRVADISSDLLGSFGGAALESSKKIEMLKEMNALLAVGTLSANVTMESLFETLKTSAPIGTSLGMSMKDMIATTSVLGSAGIKGTEAATAMKNIFLRLVKPTADVTSALDDLRLNQRDFVNESGGLKSTAEIFGLIGERTKGMENVKVAALFSSLAGLRGIAGASVIAANIDQIKNQMIKMGEDPQAAMIKTADFMRQSLGNRIKILGSAAVELGFKFFNAFAKDGGDGLTKLSNAISEFDPTPITDTLKFLFDIMKGIFSFISPIISFLPMLAKGWAAYKFYLVATYVTQKAMIALEWIKYLWMMRGAIVAAIQAQNGLNVAMSLNPIGIIITGIVALVGALKYLYDNFGLITVQWEFGWNVFLSKMALAQYRIYEFLTSIPQIGAAFQEGFNIAKVNLVQTDDAAQNALRKLKEVEDSYDEKKFLGMFSGKIGGNLTSPPNQAEAMNRSNVNVSGTIGVSGPPGTTVQKDKKSSPGFNMALMGAG